MGVLSDRQIFELCKRQNLLSPLPNWGKVPGRISYGISSYGCDIRIQDKAKIFTNVYGPVLDPKNFDSRAFVEVDATREVVTNADGKKLIQQYFIIPPNSFMLTYSIESFNIPRDLMVICLGKSTYARMGIIVNVTPLEAGWEAETLAIEITNTAPLPAKVYANEGIAQLIFLRGEQECEVSYADKKGKYQNQGLNDILPKGS